MPYSFSRVLVGAIIAVFFMATLAACSQEHAPSPSALPTGIPNVPTPAPAPPTPMPAAPPTTPAMPLPTATATATAIATATAKPEPTAEAPAEPPAEPSEASEGATAFVLGEGTVARYKVEEELARQGYFVATGETTDVEGRIVFDEDSGIVADESGIVMQAGTLKTDSDRRDRYVRERTLLTAQYPEIVFQPTSAEGLPSPLSEASGTVEFTISGDLTIRDQTRPVTWDVTAEFGNVITGIAAVEITFEQFAMDKPSVAIVLSVEDTIRLEIAFVGSLEQAAAMGKDMGGAKVDVADESLAQALGDPDAPVTVVEFSDFQ